MFDVVLVGADDSTTARRAVEAATEIAVMSSGTLHIMTAFNPGKRVDASQTREFQHLSTESDSDALLQSLSFIAKKRGLVPVLHAAKGDAADVLIEKAKEINADLVVVGNRGMKGVGRVLGSIPNSVAHGSPCSVLIFDTTD
jgi:nucleotide-binding universal stress UspA family protein